MHEKFYVLGKYRQRTQTQTTRTEDLKINWVSFQIVRIGNALDGKTQAATVFEITSRITKGHNKYVATFLVDLHTIE